MTFTLSRSLVLSVALWSLYTRSLDAAIQQINRNGPLIFGANGTGRHEANCHRVRFNGNALAHRWLKSQPHKALHPAECDDAHEDFILNRVAPGMLTGGQHFVTIETAGKPYAATVRVAYLLLRHYFPTQTLIITAPGTPEEWMHAFTYARCVEPAVTVPPECLHAFTHV